MTNRFYQPFDLETWEGDRSKGDNRTAFQVDRDRILFSYAFRRLQSKTQVFQSGQYDFYRTRLTHSIEAAGMTDGLAIRAYKRLYAPEFGSIVDLA